MFDNMFGIDVSLHATGPSVVNDTLMSVKTKQENVAKESLHSSATQVQQQADTEKIVHQPMRHDDLPRKVVEDVSFSKSAVQDDSLDY